MKECEECLADQFSAKNKAEEAFRDEIRELERLLEDAQAAKAIAESDLEDMEGFLVKMVDYSPVWGKTYKTHIKQFLLAKSIDKDIRAGTIKFPEK